jgi:hypothetical protein
LSRPSFSAVGAKADGRKLRGASLFVYKELSVIRIVRVEMPQADLQELQCENPARLGDFE